jgi:flagellar basal-body rod modification protein FlgD
MAVDAAAAAANAQSGNSTALGRARLAENFDTFLSLLTTQLKNQDPLSPLDSNQFTQQLTQMTGVEQQLATNDLLKQLVGNTANGLSTAVSLIGKQVKAVSDDAALVNGKATWTYNLDPGAADVKLEVLDEKGNIVQAVAADSPKAGDNTFTWDGKNRSGNKLPDGTYTLRVTAKDSQGGTVDHITYVNGLVGGVEQSNGSTLISVGGTKVSWDKVTSVLQPPAAPATTTNTTTPDAA